MLQNELFQEQERPFVGHFLSDLNKCFPGIFGSELSAIRALTVLYQIFYLEDLFQDRVGENLVAISADLETRISTYLFLYCH